MEQKSDMFCLTVKFDQNMTTPHVLFKSIADMLIEFQKIDILLTGTIISDIEPVFILDQVEHGSIKVWLRQLLNNIPDEAIMELDAKKILGSFLVRGKHKVLEKMEQTDFLTEPKKIDEFVLELDSMAKETKFLPMENYSEVNKRSLLLTMNEMSRIAKQLPEESEFIYESMEEKTNINKSFFVNEKFIEQISDTQTITNENVTMILKIKQPDYLGNAQWVFKHDQKNLYANIDDEEWIETFRNRNVVIKPGDSMKVKVSSEIQYDKYQNIISEKYTVTRVLEIISIEDGCQIHI